MAIRGVPGLGLLCLELDIFGGLLVVAMRGVPGLGLLCLELDIFGGLLVVAIRGVPGLVLLVLRLLLAPSSVFMSFADGSWSSHICSVRAVAIAERS